MLEIQITQNVLSKTMSPDTYKYKEVDICKTMVQIIRYKGYIYILLTCNYLDNFEHPLEAK